MASWTWLFGLLWLLACGVGVGEAKRPELIGSSVWYAPNATLLNVNFDAALVQMVCSFFASGLAVLVLRPFC